ncbi:MAG TPA: hypothetical protein VKA81_05080 [Verrucomicrobiae bacterium]|nr:hypothetical protein [Verrucomicrobiae bacterium]
MLFTEESATGWAKDLRRAGDQVDAGEIHFAGAHLRRGEVLWRVASGIRPRRRGRHPAAWPERWKFSVTHECTDTLADSRPFSPAGCPAYGRPEARRYARQRVTAAKP